MSISTLAEAKLVAHTLSSPSKMPGYGYSIPAFRCKVGSLLRQIKGTVCNSCYALKGRYVFPVVIEAMERRFRALEHPLWVDAMVFQINHYAKKSTFFRWHDSGDLQSEEHLWKICEVARRTPHVKHWLPTREVKLVNNYTGSIPENLIIRVSAAKIGTQLSNTKVPTSSVGLETDAGFQCSAYTRQGKCGPCRACWDKEVQNVNYPLH